MSYKHQFIWISLVAGALATTAPGQVLAASVGARESAALSGKTVELPSGRVVRLYVKSADRQGNAAEPGVSGHQNSRSIQLPWDDLLSAQQYYGRAIKAFQQGDYRVALQMAQNAVRGDAGEGSYHALAAQAMFALGDYHAAADQVRAEGATESQIVWQTLYRYYNYDVKRYTDQLNALATFVEKYPADADAHLLLGYEYMIVQRPALARQQFREVLRLSPFDDFAKRFLIELS